MRARTIFLSIVLIFMIPVMTNAQIGNVLRNKVGKVINAGAKAANKEADKEIDTAAQKGVQKAREQARENADQKKAEQEEETEQQGGDKPSGGFNLGGLMGGNVTSKYNDSYLFNNRISMQMEVYSEKEPPTKMDYFIYFNDITANAGFESKMVATSDDGDQVAMTSSFVFDGDNKAFLIMTDMGNMKMGIISEVPEEGATESQSAKEANKVTITKTGNTRVIAGYKCDEYIYIESDSKDYGKLWATKDLRLQADKRTFSKAGLSSYYGSPELEDAVVLAMESYNKKNELEMKSETKEVNLGYKHTISTSGYTFRQMNFSQAGGKKK